MGTGWRGRGRHKTSHLDARGRHRLDCRIKGRSRLGLATKMAVAAVVVPGTLLLLLLLLLLLFGLTMLA
jgi:hypothetical protein